MLKLFKTILKAGEATTKYPFAPFPVSPGFRGKPQLNAEQCISCSACTIACPANALSMKTDVDAGTRTWSIFLGRCIFCGRCEEVCPTKAIALTEEFELAVGRKEDLYQSATFKLTSCTVCAKPFAPLKEIEYAMALLVQSGMPAEQAEAQRGHFATCPECKRKQNVTSPNKAALGAHMNKGML